MSIKEHDDRTIRCPMLGHELTFGYCRRPGRDLPCSRIFDCWHETFGVEDFIRDHYTEEQIQQILAPPKPKMTSLLELIQQAQKNATDSKTK
jgi:hypothetical protein